MMKFKILPELPTKRQVPSSSRDSSTGTEQDEVDMANCLILLARGDTPTDVYDCKTCNRTFPSFQALGGHRASYKRPRLKSPAAADEGVRRLGNKLSSKIHECSICGSVFASGQALGGHMRRHRAITTAAGKNDAASRVVIGGKPRSAFALDLDLNMPAPAEVDEKCNQQPRMVFSAAALLVIGG